MFTVGDKVWCLIHGQGVVAEVYNENYTGSRGIIVKFNNKLSCGYTRDGRYYGVEGNITLFPYPVEVVKVITKPSIDWSHVSENFQYLAMDGRGLHHLFVEKPERISAEWITHAPYIYADHFASFIPGTCDWEDSLVKRPE